MKFTIENAGNLISSILFLIQTSVLKDMELLGNVNAYDYIFYICFSAKKFINCSTRMIALFTQI